jgi:hypothetical protein
MFSQAAIISLSKELFVGILIIYWTMQSANFSLFWQKKIHFIAEAIPALFAVLMIK